MKENCTPQGYYTASSFGTAYWSHLQGSIRVKESLNPEEGTDRLSQNASKRLPLILCNNPE